MQKADVILLLGARLNWILHFGKPPRFSSEVTVIQIDICAEELDANKTLALQGDIAASMQLLLVRFTPSHPFPDILLSTLSETSKVFHSLRFVFKNIKS